MALFENQRLPARKPDIMDKIGIFFGTETGTTRLIAKKIHKKLGDALADKPVNVNRSTAADLMRYDALILGIPSYGVGELPGLDCGCMEHNWAEFFTAQGLPDLKGKRVALFGLGAQERYADRFASSLFALYEKILACGGEIIGEWPAEGYSFEHSAALVDGRFVGLVLDQRTQGMHTETRIEQWLAVILPLLKEKLAEPASA